MTTPTLTRRQSQIMRLLVHESWERAQIADHLDMAYSTVNKHIEVLYDKLGVHSRQELVIYALKHGWITMESEMIP